VFGTLHTTSAISTVDRIVDVFPTDAQQQVRVQLSGTLQGVISQTLVAKIGGGRVAAREILVATDAVRSLIREAKTAQMLNLMQTGRAVGMTTLEDELLRLVRREGSSAPTTPWRRPTGPTTCAGGSARAAAGGPRRPPAAAAPAPAARPAVVGMRR
jgi:Tfp pilus assembly pilus retraction ATPase PilT